MCMRCHPFSHVLNGVLGMTLYWFPASMLNFCLSDPIDVCPKDHPSFSLQIEGAVMCD